MLPLQLRALYLETENQAHATSLQVSIIVLIEQLRPCFLRGESYNGACADLLVNLQSA